MSFSPSTTARGLEIPLDLISLSDCGPGNQQACPACGKKRCRVYRDSWGHWIRCFSCMRAGRVIEWLKHYRGLTANRCLESLISEGILAESFAVRDCYQKEVRTNEQRNEMEAVWSKAIQSAEELNLSAEVLKEAHQAGWFRRSLASAHIPIGAARVRELRSACKRSGGADKLVPVARIESLPGLLVGFSYVDGGTKWLARSTGFVGLDSHDTATSAVIVHDCSDVESLSFLYLGQSDGELSCVGVRSMSDLGCLMTALPDSHMVLCVTQPTPTVFREAYLRGCLVFVREFLGIHRSSGKMRHEWLQLQRKKAMPVPESLRFIFKRQSWSQERREKFVADMLLPVADTERLLKELNFSSFHCVGRVGPGSIEIDGKTIVETPDSRWMKGLQLWSDTVVRVDTVTTLAETGGCYYSGRLIKDGVEMQFCLSHQETSNIVLKINEILLAHGLSPWTGSKDFNKTAIQAALRWQKPQTEVVSGYVGWDRFSGRFRLPAFSLCRRGMTHAPTPARLWHSSPPGSSITQPSCNLSLSGLLARRPPARGAWAIWLHYLFEALAQVSGRRPRELLVSDDLSWEFAQRMAHALGSSAGKSGHKWPTLETPSPYAIRKCSISEACGMVLSKKARFFSTLRKYGLTPDEEVGVRGALSGAMAHCLTSKRAIKRRFSPESVLFAASGWFYKRGSSRIILPWSRMGLLPPFWKKHISTAIDTKRYRSVAMAEMLRSCGQLDCSVTRSVISLADLRAKLRLCMPSGSNVDQVISEQASSGFLKIMDDEVALDMAVLRSLKEPSGTYARRNKQDTIRFITTGETNANRSRKVRDRD